MKKLKPDGKLATICTMIMVFSCVISIMIYNDDSVQNQIFDAIKTSELVLENQKKDGTNLITDKDIREIVTKNMKTPMLTIPIMCTLIQTASLYIFMNSKVCNSINRFFNLNSRHPMVSQTSRCLLLSVS